MSVKINIKKMSDLRLEKAIPLDALKHIVSNIKFTDEIDKYLYSIFLKAADLTDKYIYLPWLAKATDIPLYRLKFALPKTKKLFLSLENLIVTNLRGVGYKVAVAFEAKEEMGKSMGRGLSHMTNFYQMMDLSDYDWKALKDTYPQHYELFLKTELTASYMKAFHQANKKIFEESGKIMKLISTIRKEVSQPEFYLDKQQELALN